MIQLVRSRFLTDSHCKVAEAWTKHPDKVKFPIIWKIKEEVQLFGIDAIDKYAVPETAAELGHVFMSWIRQIPYGMMEYPTFKALLDRQRPYGQMQIMDGEEDPRVDIAKTLKGPLRAPLAFLLKYLYEIHAVDSSSQYAIPRVSDVFALYRILDLFGCVGRPQYEVFKVISIFKMLVEKCHVIFDSDEVCISRILLACQGELTFTGSTIAYNSKGRKS